MAEPIIVCEHVADDQQPDFVLMENHNVHYALCGPCARTINDSKQKERAAIADSLSVLCPEHAGSILHLATHLTVDGFWINHPETGWFRQPDEAVA